MKIRFTYYGNRNETGNQFVATTVVRVETDEEAEIEGQKFARLVDKMMDGAMGYQRAVWGDGS